MTSPFRSDHLRKRAVPCLLRPFHHADPPVLRRSALLCGEPLKKARRLMPGRSSDFRAFRTAHLPALLVASLKRYTGNGQWPLVRGRPHHTCRTIPGYSGGTIPDFHGIPFLRVCKTPLRGPGHVLTQKSATMVVTDFRALKTKKSPCLQLYASMGIPNSILQVGRTLYHGSAPLLYDPFPVSGQPFLLQTAPLTRVEISREHLTTGHHIAHGRSSDFRINRPFAPSPHCLSR